MDLTTKQLGELIGGMRSAYARGDNAMAYARETLEAQGFDDRNLRLSTLVAYDLQAGTYIDAARKDPESNARWCRQLAALIAPELPKGGSLLELGVGEATTLAGVLAELGRVKRAFGFDISWSRIKVANGWLDEQKQVADLFVGDLLNIPMADNSIDLVYSSHSLEPNGGQEEEAIKECLRVARRAVVLIEPIYELSSVEAQARMRHHGYVRGLRQTAERLGAEVVDYRLLEHVSNPLNPSGVLALRKVDKQDVSAIAKADANDNEIWRCPLTGARLEYTSGGYFAKEVGLIYPVLGGIPMLRAEHAVVASAWSPHKS